MKEHITKSEEETRKLAADFASKLIGGEVVELIGDLGSGKTTFVRGVVDALGSSVRVKSPTFTVLNEYPVNGETIKRIAHLDLYRFNDPVQLEALALEDYKRADTIIFIEWPDIFEEPMITAQHRIEFEFIDESTRKISM
jgi:tRNA threonylcarbamoyladenosine biosynthesis protein TsaE